MYRIIYLSSATDLVDNIELDSLLLTSKNNNKEIVSSTFIDSLTTNYKTPKEIVLNKEEMLSLQLYR